MMPMLQFEKFLGCVKIIQEVLEITLEMMIALPADHQENRRINPSYF